MLYTKSKNALVQKATVIVTGIIICSTLLIIQSYGQKKKNIVNSYYVQTYPNDTVYVEDPTNGKLEAKIAFRNPDTIYKQVDQMPEFYGGQKELFKYISDNLVYPNDSKLKKIEGRVVIQFVVDEEGEIKNVKEIFKPKNGEELVKEAIRVVRKMPKWKAGKVKGKAINVEYVLPITFKL